MAKKTAEFLEWAVRGNHLLSRARRIISEMPSEKIRSLKGRIPSSVLTADSRIRVVFAGQYSAGKSTILRALTGRDDIEVGVGIVTREAHTYEWDGVELIDTPGVHTEIRPDHDEITYRAIADSDLLVFVVTNELFDSHLSEHFRKLAIERDKGHEMMLVVNKMQRCAKGNTSEMQAVIREDLRRVLAPFSPEDLRTSFIDAEATLESRREADEAIAGSLRRQGGFAEFVAALNAFVRDKGLTARYTTSLYNLEQVVQEALVAETSGDTDVEALEELLLQRRRALMETQQRVPRAVEAEILRTSAEIRSEGRRAADLIHGSVKQKDIDCQLQGAQRRVQDLADVLGKTVQKIIGGQMADLEHRLGAIAESELAQELLARLGRRLGDQVTGAEISPEVMARLRQTSDVSRQLGEFLVRNSFNPKSASLAGLFKLNQYSGTAAHEAVLTIGRFFGKSFKPWEAVKWARAVANAGRVLAVAGTVLTFILQIKEDCDAIQLEKDLRESRSAVRTGFNEAAHAIETHYDETTKTYVANTITKEIEAVDAQLAELREMQQSRGRLFDDLLALLEDTRAMIRELHSVPV
jgi:small GTP-binding protein